MTEDKTEEWYNKYYEKKGEFRNDIIRNPGVMFQTLASDRAYLEALKIAKITNNDFTAADFGSGSGGSVMYLLSVAGMKLINYTGIDIIEERIKEGRERWPTSKFIFADAQNLDIPSDSYDIVTESTMFVQITDDVVAKNVLSTMCRVLKPGGFMLLRDWTFPYGGGESYKALTKKRLEMLLPANMVIRAKIKGPLVPPLGRFLSKHLPSLYFLVQALMPFLVGQHVYVVERTG